MIRTRVGYAGGTREHPTYRALGDHTEAVWIEFDPDQITFEALLEVFWDAHDPYGPKRSTQYKAVLWTHGEKQAEIARAFIEKKTAALKRKRKLRTEVAEAGRFWIAEDYHQKYRLRRHPKLLRTLFGKDPDEAAFRDSTVAARVNGWLEGHGTDEEIEAALKALSLTDVQRKAIERALP